MAQNHFFKKATLLLSPWLAHTNMIKCPQAQVQTPTWLHDLFSCFLLPSSIFLFSVQPGQGLELLKTSLFWMFTHTAASHQPWLCFLSFQFPMAHCGLKMHETKSSGSKQFISLELQPFWLVWWNLAPFCCILLGMGLIPLAHVMVVCLLPTRQSLSSHLGYGTDCRGITFT